MGDKCAATINVLALTVTLLRAVTAAVTEGNIFTPSTDRPNRITASGPSTAATATASVPSATVIAAVAAATFISVPASCGLVSTQRRSAPVTRLTESICPSVAGVAFRPDY